MDDTLKFWWPKATLLGVAILDDLRQTNSHPKMITVFYTYIDNWKWHQVSSSFVSANCKPFLFKSTNQPLRLQTYWRQDGGIPTHLTCCRFEVQALHPTCEQSLTRLSLYSYHAVSRNSKYWTLPSSNGSSQYSIIETISSSSFAWKVQKTWNSPVIFYLQKWPTLSDKSALECQPLHILLKNCCSWTPLLRCIGLSWRILLSTTHWNNNKSSLLHCRSLMFLMFLIKQEFST